MSKTLLLASLLVAACNLDGSTPTDADQPIATYPSRTGTTIEIFGRATGYAALERGDATSPMMIAAGDVDTMSPSTLYAKTTGDPHVPAEIAALTDRIGATFGDARDLVAVASTPAPVFAEALDGCDARTFQQKDCPNNGDSITWCVLDHWNGGYEHLSWIHYSQAWLCMKSGSATWNVTNGDGGSHHWDVLEGELFNYWLTDNGTFGTWLNYDIDNASNNEFQFGGYAG